MQKIFVLMVVLGCSFYPTFSKSAGADFGEESKVHGRNADDEYDRYKKRADEFFDKGDYQNALRQYRNCLEVPTYENDPYAKGRIALVEKLIKLRQQAYQSLNAGKGEEAVALFEQVVADNPKDSITKVNLTDYWTEEANKSYVQQNYEQAKSQYEQARKYASKPALIQVQIQNSETYIKQKAEQAARTAEAGKKVEPQPDQVISKVPVDPPANINQPKATIRKRYVGIKLAAAAVGLGAAAYAYTLNNNYQSKLDEVERIGKTVDSDGDNIILTTGEYNQWQTAYKETTDAKQNRSKFMASLGVVGAAAITEVILLALPKKKKLTGFSLESSTQHVGLAVRYTFR